MGWKRRDYKLRLSAQLRGEVGNGGRAAERPSTKQLLEASRVKTGTRKVTGRTSRKKGKKTNGTAVGEPLSRLGESTPRLTREREQDSKNPLRRDCAPGMQSRDRTGGGTR